MRFKLHIIDLLSLFFSLDLFYDARYSHTKMTNPDFILLAQAMGVHAIRCSTAEELPAKMKEFLEYDGSKPILMECLVERNEHVFPMVSSFDSSLRQILTFELSGTRWESAARTVPPPILEGSI